ncbi:MAG TPA: regulatory protein RecX [Actinomycetota bacterium]|nr:regulatory protein RecX [Actinomycetota bacterium]
MTQPQSDPYEVARLIGLQQVEARPRTEQELRDILCRRGIPGEVADAVVRRFVEVGLLDDRAYARLWVESRIRSRGLGVAALRRELRTHKVPSPVIDEVLAGIDADDSLRSAVDHVRGRVARCSLPLDVRDERRMVAFLMRRGHDPQSARQAVLLAVAEVTAADAAG